uniref:Uncharacterized protein n=1 Tax=Cucumis melo TaxID=3656 RepID=A0A9I9EDC7_CUCME
MKKTGQFVFTRNQKDSGFSCISECTGGVRISIWFGLKAYSIYYNFHEGQVKEVVCARFLKLFCFEGYLSLFTGNQIYMSSELQLSMKEPSKIPLLTLSILCNNDAVVSVEGPHYVKDDRSARWAPLHRRACKGCCTGCTLHNILHSLYKLQELRSVSLGLLVKSVNSE